jgi:ATP-dependent helicase/nuclease subunit B
VARARLIISPSAAARLAAARDHVRQLLPAELLIVGSSRAAADELAAGIAAELGGLFGVARAGFIELITRLALPALAKAGLSPTGGLGAEAVATRVAFEVKDGGLTYFSPVASMPGFPRAAARTLDELQQAHASPRALAAVDDVGPDLATLLERVESEHARSATVTRASLIGAAAGELTSVRLPHIVLLDVAIASKAERDVLESLVRAAASIFVTVPSGDTRSLSAWSALGFEPVEPAEPVEPVPALHRLQSNLFAPDLPTPAPPDDTVVVFSAPGEGREAVEIARRVMQEARRGVRFDEMAVLLRAPQTYLSVLEHALERAGIPAWFHRGTRRPDAAGRACLALLACAEEGLSARRFAEYVSLGQVPMKPPESGADGPWTPPSDEATDAVVPPQERDENAQPEQEAREALEGGETDRAVAGTLRAPWRWEELIVEAAVIGLGIDRWRARLSGLEEDYRRRLREAESDDPGSPRTRALRRVAEQLRALRAFAEPVLAQMHAWPAAQSWGEWLATLRALVPTVIGKPARVLRVLQELGPLDTIGPVTLREVRDVLTPRLSTVSHDPPRRRQGRLFVGTPHGARGRAFKVVFVPGLAERLFPQKIREDALLPDDRRQEVSGDLAVQPTRAADERLQLSLAVGAASERLYVSFPRIEVEESRPRVPSFYVLDIVRAIEGTIPAASTIVARAHTQGASTLAWPAPRDASLAIDDFEHDLSTLGALLSSPDRAKTKGRARYLYDLSPELQRSLTTRWQRWHPKQWTVADGLVRSVPETTGPALARQRLNTRPYSLTALQRFSACPYQFLLAAIYRLAPLEQPAPLQQLDPLTRGSLFHSIQAKALERLQGLGMLPLSKETLPKAQKMLEWAVTEVERDAREKLAPAIERVWQDEMTAMTRDLKIWLEHLAAEGTEWTPERFEFAFGLDDTAGRDEHSTRETAQIGTQFRLRGSIDLIERHRQTGFLRVTDHKTGRNYTERGHTIVHGGRILQPVIYGLALEALWPDQTVYSGRLFFCTTAGGFATHEIPLMSEARRHGIEVLEIIDRSIEHGLLAARPDKNVCKFCDFQDVCGRDEERRTRRKDGSRFADLEALRQLK